MSDPLDTPLVREGLGVVRRATEADAAGDNSGAVRLYTQACTLFLQSLKSPHHHHRSATTLLPHSVLLLRCCGVGAQKARRACCWRRRART